MTSTLVSPTSHRYPNFRIEGRKLFSLFPRSRRHTWQSTDQGAARESPSDAVQCNQGLIWTPDCLVPSRFSRSKKKKKQTYFLLLFSVNPNGIDRDLRGQEGDDHGWIRGKSHVRDWKSLRVIGFKFLFPFISDRSEGHYSPSCVISASSACVMTLLMPGPVQLPNLYLSQSIVSTRYEGLPISDQSMFLFQTLELETVEVIFSENCCPFSKGSRDEKNKTIT